LNKSKKECLFREILFVTEIKKQSEALKIDLSSNHLYHSLFADLYDAVSEQK